MTCACVCDVRARVCVCDMCGGIMHHKPSSDVGTLQSKITSARKQLQHSKLHSHTTHAAPTPAPTPIHQPTHEHHALECDVAEAQEDGASVLERAVPKLGPHSRARDLVLEAREFEAMEDHLSAALLKYREALTLIPNNASIKERIAELEEKVSILRGCSPNLRNECHTVVYVVENALWGLAHVHR